MNMQIKVLFNNGIYWYQYIYLCVGGIVRYCSGKFFGCGIKYFIFIEVNVNCNGCVFF